jgi:N-acetylglucosaminyl-diphospho-decaprenol L-rhamnosyltransferase
MDDALAQAGDAAWSAMIQAPLVDVTLSIVSFNTADLLRRCLQSIEALAPGLAIQTIVVDNASSDGSAAMVAAEFPWVELVRNQRNRYFAPAHNQALRLARGRYVALLNPDTRLFPDTIARMVSFMDARPDAGVSTCLFAGEDGAPLNAEAHNYWRFHSLLYAAICRNAAGDRVYRALGGRPFEPISHDGDVLETDVVSGAFLFVRRKALERVGGFDAALLMYATEDDLCAGVKRQGYRVFYYPGTRLVHAVSASVRRSNPFKIRWIFATDLMRYFHKYGTGLERVLAVPVLFGAYLIDASVIVSRGGRWK